MNGNCNCPEPISEEINGEREEVGEGEDMCP